jgi:hypothetical protein
VADASAFLAVVLNESDRKWVINKTLGRKIVSPENLPYEIGNALIKEIYMPTISMFFGIVVSLYFIDNRKHKRPYIHVKYQDSEAVISIPNGELLDGELPPAKMRLVLAWIEIHKDELMADWDLAVSGQQPFKIDPLR